MKINSRIVFLIISCVFVQITYSSENITISGRVTDDRNNFVSGAKITIYRQDNEQSQTYTDSQGYYSISLPTIINIDRGNNYFPNDFTLFQNYPNPFNPNTIISFNLRSPCYAKLDIYNILGQKIHILADNYFPAGLTTINWNGIDKRGSGVSSGIYFYCLRTKYFTSTKKMLLLDGGITTNNYSLVFWKNICEKVDGPMIMMQKQNKQCSPLNIEKFIVAKDGFHDHYERNFEIDTDVGSIIKNIELINLDSLKLFVIEEDHIFGGFCDVDNFHRTFIINTSHDSIRLNVESPTPKGLKRESIRSPAFGRYAYFQFDFSKYFNVPDMAIDYLTDIPDEITDESYFWNNIKLAPSDAVHVPYSNYLGEGEDLFIKDFGVNSFLGLDVISNYLIEKDSVNSSYLNLRIKQTMKNTYDDTLFMVGIVLHIPKVLNTKPIDTKLYNLISDTVICDERFEYYRDNFRVDGFSMGASGQTIITRKDTLLSDESFEFIFEMIIEPLLDKFEIYPMYLVNIETKDRNRMWPASIIIINENKYNGPVNYFKVCGLSIPTYILFSIDNGALRVVSPDDIDPTFISD
ncbi:carboxypeptidase regulatory-like domain-containing protein [bacterium]|nr:carboxypeptidase regulatory-like domain-containing protein [Bacteroidales bacterium]MCK5685118.1 carboxypeptidase regulatory-like domain-containing protein [bacterium]